MFVLYYEAFCSQCYGEVLFTLETSLLGSVIKKSDNHSVHLLRAIVPHTVKEGELSSKQEAHEDDATALT